MPLNPNVRPEQGQLHQETSKVYVELYLRREGLWMTKPLHLQLAHHHGWFPFDGWADVSPWKATPSPSAPLVRTRVGGNVLGRVKSIFTSRRFWVCDWATLCEHFLRRPMVHVTDHRIRSGPQKSRSPSLLGSVFPYINFCVVPQSSSKILGYWRLQQGYSTPVLLAKEIPWSNSAQVPEV